jgi:hypothetical protein
VTGPDDPYVRVLALGAVVLVVAAAGAVTGDARVPVLGAAAGALGLAAALRWRAAGRTGVSTSAAVAAVLVGLLLVERVTSDVDVALAVTSAVALGAGVLLAERRLVVSGLLTLGVLLGRPLPGAATFTHCLVATDVSVPLPRLDGPLWLAVGATVVGTAGRWGRWGPPGVAAVARGFEVTGAIAVVALLLAKAAELPGHRLLCGAGDAVDEGWLLAGVVVGVAAGLYGLAAGDALWMGVGLVSVTGQGLLGTTLSGSWWWALGCGALLVAALATADRLRLPWPTRPGYDVARPHPTDLLDRVRR